MKRNHGFTLIELLIVIGIVGVLAAVGGLGGSALLQTARLNSAVTTIETQVGNARRFAKETDEPVALTVEESAGAWVVKVGSRATDLQGASVTSGPASMTLYPPYGTYPGAAQTIRVQVGNRSAQVHVTGVFARTVVDR
ncbi:MAG: prepilin-type N-terminal cleavage/methylation domain-containing protein [Truepera sp.]|jgi:prepilin-type N-terminal cleavage/methylation domain-containing protein|nr:prepilin-type N-terminal cleavage/methylation domain-containing protein [Truepera sp.]